MLKAEIHPKYYEKARVTCACGNTFVVGDTVPELKLDICAKCHPFYTGEQKLIDVAGRVERFKTRAAKMVIQKPKKVRVKKEKVTK